MTCNTSAVGGLLLQRLARLIDQAYILDRDHGLCSEVLHQRNLLVGKRPHLPAVHVEGAEQEVVLAQSYTQDGARAAQVDKGVTYAVAGSIELRRGHIQYVNNGLAPY